MLDIGGHCSYVAMFHKPNDVSCNGVEGRVLEQIIGWLRAGKEHTPHRAATCLPLTTSTLFNC
jgi:hypothetical protein